MSTRDLVLIALLAAITAVLGLFPALTLPLTGVPVTAQTLGVMLAGSLLGARRGGLALVVFLVLVALGLPLLAGGRGGAAVFAGVTAGFLFSWPVAAFAIGWMTEKSWSRYDLKHAILINVAGGILVVYAGGLAWMSAVAGIPLDKALFGSLPFIPGDALKVAAASAVAVTLKRYHQHPLGQTV
ncbi:biotin transporter BioY [Nisaea acidiphila]|uniref:Biotin transporter n=1 Tax=Nisaea acidiphila TaxID=1862145 RepID=A0A9J7ALN8_9PROT|nr:biotin transporter BioY [Nisaea acidiphila]UUX48563.1 biotin transporter BioY [Nisaea acidiphila]